MEWKVKRIDAIINSELLVWARKSSGFPIDLAAKKLGITKDKLEEWEAGSQRPTIKQLRKIGQLYKRPIAVFYLPEAPKDFQPLKEFRKFPGTFATVESPTLQFEIRRAIETRDEAIELFEDLEGSKPLFQVQFGLTGKSTFEVAGMIRDFLEIEIEEQINQQTSYDAFNLWRNKLENTGVIVLQAAGIDLDDMRGFSISERPFPTIVVNNKDIPEARIFSLIHEFTHVLLNKGGICDFQESMLSEEKKKIEAFCNKVAGEVLVPIKELKSEKIVISNAKSNAWDLSDLRILAKRYSVSQEMMLYRLLNLEFITNKIFTALHVELKSRKKPRQSGFAPPATMAISKAGILFSKLVLNSYYANNITASDLSDLLNIKLKHLGKIEKSIFGYNIRFGVLS